MFGEDLQGLASNRLRAVFTPDRIGDPEVKKNDLLQDLRLQIGLESLAKAIRRFHKGFITTDRAYPKHY